MQSTNRACVMRQLVTIYIRCIHTNEWLNKFEAYIFAASIDQISALYNMLNMTYCISKKETTLLLYIVLENYMLKLLLLFI